MDGSGPASGESDAVVGEVRSSADTGRREHPSRAVAVMVNRRERLQES
jgi:hypothetical protein